MLSDVGEEEEDSHGDTSSHSFRFPGLAGALGHATPNKAHSLHFDAVEN